MNHNKNNKHKKNNFKKPVMSVKTPNKPMQVKHHDKPMPAKPKEQLEFVRIKKIGILSVANTMALIYVIFGLIVGIAMALSSLLIGEAVSIAGMPSYVGTLFGVGAIIIFPISLGIVGWIQGIIIGLFYNLSAKISRGVKLYA